MGTNTKVMTQSTLLELNAALEQLASNLSLHVNESLSVAHGVNAAIADYFDDNGDKWGNVVIAFDFGTPPNAIRLHVPAQITTLGPASASSGLVSDGSASGSFSSTGIPLVDKPLITEVTTDAAIQATTYSNLLLAHASTVHSDTGADQCHGGQSYVTGVTSDSLGHRVGRQYITIGAGGISWKLPCDTRQSGPPISPTLGDAVAVYSSPNSSSVGGKWYLDSNNVLWFVEGPNNKWYTVLTITTPVSGSAPIDYAWEWAFEQSGPWLEMVQGVPFGKHHHEPAPDNYFVPTSNPTGTIASTPGNISVSWTIPVGGGNGQFQYYWRLRAQNTGIGGEVTYSPVYTIYFKIKSG